MAIVVAILLGVLALAFVLYPLYRRSSKDVAREAGDTVSSGEQEQSARAALQEVELDYQLGNITEAEYKALREGYTRRALVAMKWRYEHEIDEEIEEQLRLLQEKLSSYPSRQRRSASTVTQSDETSGEEEL